MFRQPFVFFFIPLELFLLLVADAAKQFFCSSVIIIYTLQYAHILIIPDNQTVGCIDMAFAERQIVDGIHKIGLAHSVLSEEAIDLG